MSRSAPNESLSAYLDGELNEAEAAALEAELAANAELRAELDSIENVVKLLRNHGSVSAPDDFHAKVMAAAEAETPKMTWWAWLRRPFGIPMEGLAVAAAAAAVLFLALPKDSPAPTEEPVAPAAPVYKNQIKQGTSDEGVNPQVDGDAALTDNSKAKDALQQKEPVQAKSVLPKNAKPAPQGTAEAPSTESSNNGDLANNADEAVQSTNNSGSDANTDDIRPMLSNATYKYTVYVDDPEALISLDILANKHNGKLTGIDNQALSEMDLPTEGKRTVKAILPVGDIGRFQKDLAKLGSVRGEQTRESALGNTIVVEVTLAMAGGAPQAVEQAPNAARKNRMEMSDDAMEEVGEAF